MKITLDKTTTSLIVELTTVGAIPFSVSYSEQGKTALSDVAKGEDGVTNNTAPVTMVAAPASGFRRIITDFVVYNNTAGALTAIVSVLSNGNKREVKRGTLAPNNYMNGDGVFDDLGRLVASATPLAGSVTNAMLSTMPTLTLKGNNTGATAAPTDITAANVNIMLGSHLKRFSAKSANFTVATTENGMFYPVTTAASAITATLPAPAAGNIGFTATIIKVDAGVGTVVTSPATQTLTTQGHVVQLVSDGTAWRVVASNIVSINHSFDGFLKKYTNKATPVAVSATFLSDTTATNGISATADLTSEIVRISGTLGGNFTLTAPVTAGRIAGQVCLLEVLADATAGRALTFPTGFRLPATGAVSFTANERKLFALLWDGATWSVSHQPLVTV
jgi:hypothetical protein